MSFRNELITPAPLLQVLSNLISDDLGQYQIVTASGQVLATVPSIWIAPPPLPKNRKIVEESGIECVISRSPQQKIVDCANTKTASLRRWNLFLTQYDESKTTQSAIEKIVGFFASSSVVVRDQQETEKGILLEQARITIIDWKLFGLGG